MCSHFGATEGNILTPEKDPSIFVTASSAVQATYTTQVLILHAVLQHVSQSTQQFHFQQTVTIVLHRNQKDSLCNGVDGGVEYQVWTGGLSTKRQQNSDLVSS
uniref:Uncharacterized protein n=1 Tax=Echinococcus canadensis TaxID=519352 RepID=A0A915EX16_9CEST